MSLYEIQGNLGNYLLKKHAGQFQISVCVEKIKNAYVPLSSIRDPFREADRILNGFKLKKGIIVFVLGTGSVVLLEKLAKQAEISGGLLVIIDAEPVLTTFLSVNLFAEQKEKRIFFLNSSAELTGLLEQMDVERLQGYRILKCVPSIRLAEKFYEDIEFEIKTLLSSRISDFFTRLEFEPLWIFNALAQLSRFSKARSVKQLFTAAEGRTAVLVSTGPSLRLSLSFLREHQNRLFIACVDSAYRVLHRSGIRPHLIASLDSQPFTLRHFLGLPRGQANQFPVLYADLVANPATIRRWQGPLYLGITARYEEGDGQSRVVTPGCDFIEEEIFDKSQKNDETLGDVQSGGSVATTLFDLLRQMGFSTIALIGQDLAYTYREIHCIGTHHSDVWFSQSVNRFNTIERINEMVLRKRHVSAAESIQGKIIAADYILSLYKDWFENAGKLLPDVLVNLTAEGLPMKNIKHVNSEDWQFTEKENFQDFLNGILFQKDDLRSKATHIFQLYRDILNTEYDSSISEKYYFLHRIGKKFTMRVFRSASAKKDELLHKAETEKQKFWKALQQGIMIWQKKI